MINPSDFRDYLNQENITEETPNILLVKKEVPAEYKSSILIKNELDYEELITLEFSVRFEHHEYNENSIFQRQFAIEHHSKNSTHTKPHIQIKIHGDQEQKVGQLWLILELESEDEYEDYIKGFFSLLEDIMRYCRVDICKDLLDEEKISTLIQERDLIIGRIRNTLVKNGIKYEFPDGTTKQIYLDNIEEVTLQDPTLIPLLDHR